MKAFQCSNPKCDRLTTNDPQGPCPACRKPDGTGWSTYPVEAMPCDYCGVPRLPDAQFGRCDTCLTAIEYAMGTH